MKKLISFFLLFLVLIMTNTSKLNAHEIFYEGTPPSGTGINLKWDTLSSGKAHLQMNGDYLSSNFSSLYSTASIMWPTYVSTKVKVDQVSFGASKITLSTPSQTWWDNFFGGAIFAKQYLGYCESRTTDYVTLTTLNDAKNSSKKIAYASIYVSPDNKLFVSDNHRIQIMVHEIGHALGLGHSDHDYYPTTSDSVMKRAGYHGYYPPRSHDITDINNKY